MEKGPILGSFPKRDMNEGPKWSVHLRRDQCLRNIRRHTSLLLGGPPTKTRKGIVQQSFEYFAANSQINQMETVASWKSDYHV
ncbi:hypothetical protein ZHAS_00014984 [Anopheles sinensis]|uniref:Uncharacterized protein n=1 Tax=Anopheles sinensis TaxID=74873 RepID=A0A084W9S5_ANOSI|nr:hypothetical protein ZHAS_00014984 [Anopheles sinensis]